MRILATFCLPHHLSPSTSPSLFISLPATDDRLRHLETLSLRASAFTYQSFSQAIRARCAILFYLLITLSSTPSHLLRSTDSSQLTSAPTPATPLTKTAQMPKQKTVKASKRGGRGAGAGRGRGKKSAPPASEEPSDGPTPALIVRLRVPVASLPVDDAVPTPDINHDEDKDDVGTQSAVVKTRSGRAVKPKKDNTYVWGDDLSSQLASSPANRASDEIGESTYQYRGRTSTRKYIPSQLVYPNRKPDISTQQPSSPSLPNPNPNLSLRTAAPPSAHPLNPPYSTPPSPPSPKSPTIRSPSTSKPAPPISSPSSPPPPKSTSTSPSSATPTTPSSPTRPPC